MSIQEKFNEIYNGLSSDLNMAFDGATSYEKYASFTKYIDPENMIMLDAIVSLTCEGHESKNDVARSIMSKSRKVSDIVQKLLVEFYEKNFK